MALPRIYQNMPLQAGQRIELDKQAGHHLSRVLRIRNQQPFIIFNGDGHDYHAAAIIEKKKTYADIVEVKNNSTASSLHITLLQGISKGDHMDMAIQKSVELGVKEIIPVICQHTVVNLKAERAEKKLRHWQGVAIHACEQSGRSQLPSLDKIMTLDEALNSLENNSLKITLDPCAQESLSSLEPNSNTFAILIGPEGGLSQDEIQQAGRAGFSGIQMGKRILRTETAALASITAVQTLWGDFK